MASGSDVGRKIYEHNVVVRDYVDYLKSHIDGDLKGLKLFNCANGAAYKVAPMAHRELGAEVIEIHCQL